MSGRRVLFLPAYGLQIGGGHVLRCFTLAETLIGRGAVCGVAIEEDGARSLRRLRPPAVENLQRGGALATAKGFQADMVVIDDYAADERVEGELAAAGFKVAVIDDLANRSHQCSLLVDPGFGREVADYDSLVPAGAVVLTGPDHALLRSEFAEVRSAALTRRGEATGRHTLVSLGLTDIGGITRRVVELLDGIAPMTVVLGSSAPSLDALGRRPGLNLYVDAIDMSVLIAEADIGVGAGGVSVWERACLGLPSILLILADNQAAMAQALDAAGVVIAIDAREDGFEPHLIAAVERLFSDGELRERLSRSAARLCDGRGAERVADAVLAKLA